MKKQTNKQSKSYIAKLLATENITVEHRKVPTAFFDLKSRLLVVPIWKQEMSNDVLDLLLSLHEITQKENHRNACYSPGTDCLNAFWKFEEDLVWAREADLVRMKEYHN